MTAKIQQMNDIFYFRINSTHIIIAQNGNVSIPNTIIMIDMLMAFKKVLTARADKKWRECSAILGYC